MIKKLSNSNILNNFFLGGGGGGGRIGGEEVAKIHPSVWIILETIIRTSRDKQQHIINTGETR